MKELTESPPVSAFRARFEAGRSFDLDDDLEFCPGLLTEDDVSLTNFLPNAALRPTPEPRSVAHWASC